MKSESRLMDSKKHNKQGNKPLLIEKVLKNGPFRRKLDFSVIKELNKLCSKAINGVCEFALNITMAGEDQKKVIGR